MDSVHTAFELPKVQAYEDVLATVNDTRTLIGAARLSPRQRAFKRAFDVTLASVLVIISAPVFVLVALAIKLDSRGPVLFFQERIGEGARPFMIFKFRSMYADADRVWASVADRAPDGTLVHKRPNDPRVTRIGRVIRRTSLDELPQLFNVIGGEMSLVGPRPELPRIVREYNREQWRRLSVPAGITGLWQVSGRSDHPMHCYTEIDLTYIEHYSFLLDLHILWRTVDVVLQGRGAY